MRKKQKKPVRLSKKQSKKDKIRAWFSRHYYPFVIAGIFLALLLFVIFIMMFVPGTESGLYYNNFTRVV